MANYQRTVRSAIWDRAFFENMTNQEKVLYFLLLTGEETSDCSCFSISVRRIAYHMNISEPEVLELLREFEEKGIIEYDYNTSEIHVKSYFEHTAPNKGALKYEAFQRDFAKIKSKKLLQSVAETLKNYQVTVGLLSALSEFVEINEEDYDIKASKETMKSVKTVAARGREKIAELRKLKNESQEIDIKKFLEEWEQS